MLRPTLAVLLALIALPLPARAADAAHGGWCGTTPTGALTAVWEHRERMARRGEIRAAASAGSYDVGQIAVVQNDGDLVLLKNLLDLQGAGLQFVPGGAGYTVTRVDRPVTTGTGTTLALGDDASTPVAIPFAFPFFDQSYTQVFVNSDGNLTFGAGDSASTARDLGRFLSGAPRIAPLLTDLDPSAGGTVTAGGDASRFVVTWSQVPLYGSSFRNTLQVILQADGRIEFAYGNDLSTLVEEGVVGIAPGAARNGMTAVDLSAAAGVTSAGALAEGFRETDVLDAVAVTRKFYAAHGDDFQQIIVFTSRPLGRRAGYLAYELTVKNADTGIGATVLDLAAEFGSAGRLESFVTMDFVQKYPEPFDGVFFGSNSALSVMGQEVGHRWGAYARFMDGGTISDELLGRSAAHWSFFLDSDASHLEGNDIEDAGGGNFRTVAATQRYSPLDQYLIGLRPAEEVPPFFFVRNPVSFADAGSDPQVGVTFTGTRKDVTIADVVAALGPRNPAPGPRPPFRQVFVYVDAGTTEAAANIAKMDRFRGAWEPFFARSVDGRGAVDTRLQ